MSLLTIAQAASDEIGILPPDYVVQSDDPGVRFLWRLANRDGMNLMERHPWQFLVQDAEFTTAATEIQADLNDLAPDLSRIVNNTFWNRSLRRPVFGPQSMQRWNQLKALVQTGPFNQFIITDNKIRFIPIPQAGQTCVFSYVSKNWTVQGNDKFLNDSDTALFNEDLITFGVIWRWKRAKGLVWQSDYEECEQRVINEIGRDGSADILNMGGEAVNFQPGVMIPEGNWPTTSIL